MPESIPVLVIESTEAGPLLPRLAEAIDSPGATPVRLTEAGRAPVLFTYYRGLKTGAPSLPVQPRP